MLKSLVEEPEAHEVADKIQELVTQVSADVEAIRVEGDTHRIRKVGVSVTSRTKGQDSGHKANNRAMHSA